MTNFPDFGDLVRVSPEGERPMDMLMLGYMQFSRFVALVQDLDGPARPMNVAFIETLKPQHDIPEAQRYRKLFIAKSPGELFPMAGDAQPAPPAVTPSAPENDDEHPQLQMGEDLRGPKVSLPRTDMGDIPGILPPGDDRMTPEEFAEWRKRMGVSKTKAAEMIGVSRNMPAKYEAGTAPIPLVVALACAALIRGIAPWPK